MTHPALPVGLLAANLVVFSFFDHFRNDFTGLIGLSMVACCAWLSLVALRNHRGAWLLLFLPVALLWNPLLPVPLQTGEWVVAYVVAAAGLVCAAFLIHGEPAAGAAESGAPVR